MNRYSIVTAGAFYAFLTASAASAHFVLVSPEAATSQGLLGDPQKMPPCGDDGSATKTGKVTTYKPGDTITIEINETIPHPGHYRVSLAPDPSQLPPEPLVTAGSSACGSAPIDSAPSYPVLADGLLQTTSGTSGTQTMQVTLPADRTCTRCTLQVIQFMTNHGLNTPGGCFYHKCATISIVGEGTAIDQPPVSYNATGAVISDAGVAAGGDASNADTKSESSGCSLAAGGHPRDQTFCVGGLLVLATFVRRRRARAPASAA